MPSSDVMVSSPPHYQTDSGLEVIDVLEAFDLNRNLAASTKYILRAGKKGKTVQDLEKAIWYLDREITRLSCGVSSKWVKSSG